MQTIRLEKHNYKQIVEIISTGIYELKTKILLNIFIVIFTSYNVRFYISLSQITPNTALSFVRVKKVLIGLFAVREMAISRTALCCFGFDVQ